MATSWNAPPKAHSTSHKKAKHHGLIGFTENLVGDVRDMAVGLPTGIVQTVKHPKESGKLMLSSTWQTWSPLLKDHDPGEFWHQFTDHPLAPILDVASLVTLGAGSAAKGASLAARVAGREAPAWARVSYKTVEHSSGKGPTLHRSYSANPAVRTQQKLFEGLRNQLPGWRADDAYDRMLGKEVQKRSGATRAAMQLQLAAFVKAGKDISTNPTLAAKRIEDVGRAGLERHAFEVPKSALKVTAKTDKKTGVVTHVYEPPEGFTFVRHLSSVRKLSSGQIRDAHHFADYMESFSGRHAARDASDAARRNGNFLIVPLHDSKLWKKWGVEAGQSGRFVKALYDNPTKFWKWMVLATRPAYFVNNAVGNSAMYMMSFGGEGAIRGLIDAQRQVHGEARMARTMKGLDKELQKLHGDWQDKWYLGLHKGFAEDLMTEPVGHGPQTLKVPKTGKKAATANAVARGLYPVTQKYTDLFLRRAGINAILRKEPRVQELMKQGRTFDQAADIVSADPALRSMVQSRLEDALGDYHHLNKTEYRIRKLVPFYTWDRAILRHGGKLTLHKPLRVDVAGKVGQQGSQTTKDALGAIPTWMQGALPLDYFGLGGKKGGGRETILNTAGLNPYASLADLAETGQALFTGGDVRAGDAIGGQINPLASKAIEAITGRNLLTGVPSKGTNPFGVLGAVVQGSAQELPQASILDTLLNGTPKPKPNSKGERTPFLYEKDFKERMLGFLGAPVKQVNKSRAHAMAKKEQDVRSLF